MNLRQLEIFHAVVQTGSMTAAARLVCITPSAVSKIISHTELQLGYQLFTRRKGTLAPTPEAMVLFEASAPIQVRMDELRKIASNLRQTDAGQVRVAALPAITHEFLPAVIEQYARRHPQVQVEVHTLHQHQMAQALLTRTVDVALGYYGPPHPQLAGEQLASGPLYAVTTRELWRRAMRVRPSDPMRFLAATPMIRLVGEDPLREPMERLTAVLGVDRQPTLMVQTSRLALELVRRDLGWTVIDFLTARNLDAASQDALQLQELGDLAAVPLFAYHAAAWPLGQHALRLLDLVNGRLAEPGPKR